MCGGGGKTQEVTQKTELDPALRRLLYGGTIASPRGGFGSDAAATASGASNISGGGDGGMGMGPGDPSDSTGMGGVGVAGVGESPGLGIGSGGVGSPGDPGTGQGVYANGGMVMPPQQGIASLNQGQMPMMGGQMPNLSDPATAATLAMAVRRPELQYGQIMAQPQPNMPMQNPRLGFAMGGYVEGPGTGRSDDIEAQIYQDGVPVQEARLSDGEFVMTERAVKGAGGGDREAGAARMYEMMRKFENGGRI